MKYLVTYISEQSLQTSNYDSIIVDSMEELSDCIQILSNIYSIVSVKRIRVYDNFRDIKQKLINKINWSKNSDLEMGKISKK